MPNISGIDIAQSLSYKHLDIIFISSHDEMIKKCFNRNQLENILNEIKDEYQIVGTPRGIIVGRGYEGENFQRIMEIQIPIALKH